MKITVQMGWVLEWNDLKIILSIGRAGTLSGAARALNLSHSTVFRQINAIEEKLDVRFFDRLPHGYVLTEAGETAMHAAENIDDEFHNLARELVGKDLRLQGSIRVTAPEGLTSTLLGPYLVNFCKTHPDIHIDLVVTGNALQLSRREADLAVRVTNKPPDTSIGRRICRFQFGLYASRNYLKTSKHSNLTDCNWLMTDDYREWFPPAIRKKIGQPAANVIFSSNSIMAALNAAKEGLGLAILPCFLGDADKKLVRVLQPAEEMSLELWLLTHTDLRHTARVRALMHFLYDSFKNHKDLIEGKLAN